MKREKSVGGILPGDEELFDRKKCWSKLFKKYESPSKNQEPSLSITDYVRFSDLENENLDDDDDDDDETIDPAIFEDKVNNDDPELDVCHVLNETKKVIENRKKQWHDNGLDPFLDSFFKDGVGKVDNWLRNNCDYFSSKFNRNSNRFQVNERNIVLEKNYDEHSADSSVDTAAYIMSNRKRRTSKVTMTIKQFCYSAQSSRPSQPRTRSAVCHPKMLQFDKKQSDTMSTTSPKKRYSKRRKPRRTSVRCIKISSSSSDSSRHSSLQQRTRKYPARSQTKKIFLEDSDSESSTCQRGRKTVVKSSKKEMSPQKLKPIVISYSKEDIPVKPCDVLGASSDVISEIMPICNKSCAVKLTRLKSDLNSTNAASPVFNSTAIKSQDTMTQCKESFESMCNNVVTECSTKSSNSNNSNSKVHNTTAKTRGYPKEISLYTPGDPCTPQRLLKNGRFTIDEEYLEERIGTELKNRFLTGTNKKLPLNCSANSELVFIAPESTDVSSDSEADILDRLGQFSNGKILEFVRGSFENNNL